MYGINSDYTEPYFNMAAEEYLMKFFHRDIFYLWRNEPAVIIGKNQNALAEIDIDYAISKGIKIVRRMTGGGAVFHDLGNINFTFIKNNKSSDFKEFTLPIIQKLKSMGIAAEFEGRNDITINGQKISGNAMLVSGGRTLEHGTLLFSSEMNDLTKVLKPNPLKFEGKSVKSISKRVTNISNHLTNKISVAEFKDQLMDFVMKTNDCIPYLFSEIDIMQINKLKAEKYSIDEYNYGLSPNYKFSNSTKVEGGYIEVFFNVESGRMNDIRIFGDFFGNSDINDIEKALSGALHNRNNIENILTNFDMKQYMINVNVDDFINLFF